MFRFLISTLWLFSAQPLWGAVSSSKKLSEFYTAALARSELVANSEQSIRVAEETYRQSVELVLPTVSGVASYLIQESPSVLRVCLK